MPGMSMRKRTEAEGWIYRESFRLSREERDHVAAHALDSIHATATTLAVSTQYGNAGLAASSSACKIAALSNLLGDIGWERSEARPLGEGYLLGELFPVAQLRPWLEEWQHQDNEALVEAERALEVFTLEVDRKQPRPPLYGAQGIEERRQTLRQAIADAQVKLGTGAILLARIEKWMASHEN